MDCPDCFRADEQPEIPLYRIGCLECSARAVAHGPEFAKAQAARTMTPEYRAALQAIFGEAWEPHHQRVKHWASRILEARAAG